MEERNVLWRNCVTSNSDWRVFFSKVLIMNTLRVTHLLDQKDIAEHSSKTFNQEKKKKKKEEERGCSKYNIHSRCPERHINETALKTTVTKRAKNSLRLQKSLRKQHARNVVELHINKINISLSYRRTAKLRQTLDFFTSLSLCTKITAVVTVDISFLVSEKCLFAKWIIEDIKATILTLNEIMHAASVSHKHAHIWNIHCTFYNMASVSLALVHINLNWRLNINYKQQRRKQPTVYTKQQPISTGWWDHAKSMQNSHFL